MTKQFLKNYDDKTYEMVQDLLKNQTDKKKRKILEKTIKQARHAINIIRGQCTGIKRQYKGGMINERIRDEKLNLVQTMMATLMNHIRFHQHKINELDGKINTKSIFYEDPNTLLDGLEKIINGDGKAEDGVHILNKLLVNCVINEIQYKQLYEK